MEKIENKKIIFQLLKLKNILNQAGKKEIFFEHGLSLANYEVLRLIGDNEAETISEVQKFLFDSLPSLTQKTHKLEELGYLKKEIDKSDPRQKILKITPKGKKAIERIEKKIELVSSAIFLEYPKKEKEIFLKILEDLENKLSKKIS